MKKNIMEKPGVTLFDVFSAIFTIWKRETLGKLFANRKIITNMMRGSRRRRAILKKEGLLVPTALALSPTERCNLRCLGCYSRSHPREDELSPEVISSFLSEAIECGVSLFVITGGEPFLREDMIGFFETYSRGLFLVITNGTVFSEESVKRFASCKNVIPVLSLEGDRYHTDRRRGKGVFDSVMSTMELFRDRGMMYGFSTVCTKHNIDYLGSEEFVDTVVDAGCVLGFYNELIPIDETDLPYLPSKEQSEVFRQRLAVHRREKSVILIDLPRDEYDQNGRCMAVGRGAMHINAQGWVEPCPFAHYARENINTHTFREILESPFLRALREHPTALQHGDIGCSLVSNIDVLKEIAEKTGANKTSAAAGITPSEALR